MTTTATMVKLAAAVLATASVAAAASESVTFRRLEAPAGSFAPSSNITMAGGGNAALCALLARYFVEDGMTKLDKQLI